MVTAGAELLHFDRTIAVPRLPVARRMELLRELAAVPGVDRVSSVQAADESEI